MPVVLCPFSYFGFCPGHSEVPWNQFKDSFEAYSKASLGGSWTAFNPDLMWLCRWSTFLLGILFEAPGVSTFSHCAWKQRKYSQGGCANSFPMVRAPAWLCSLSLAGQSSARDPEGPSGDGCSLCTFLLSSLVPQILPVLPPCPPGSPQLREVPSLFLCGVDTPDSGAHLACSGLPGVTTALPVRCLEALVSHLLPGFLVFLFVFSLMAGG